VKVTRKLQIMNTQLKVVKLVLKELDEQAENEQIRELIDRAKSVLGQNPEKEGSSKVGLIRISRRRLSN
jgi:hypothetical protein